MDWRVGDAPIISTSGSATKILLPGAITYSGPRSEPTPKKNKTAHEDDSSFGAVYVNSLARSAMQEDLLLRFPQGSVIVREKLDKADDAQPQLLTVMIKRARGFNPEANDWEFLAVDGSMTKILERQKKGSCLGCHISQRDRDFVYPPPGK